MHATCRVFGHKAAPNLLVRDPYNFTQQGFCKRCGVALEHTREGWIASDALVSIPHRAPASLPPRSPPAFEDDDVDSAFRHPFASRQARDAYRRGAREIYGLSLDKFCTSDLHELAQWFIRLDAWNLGDPPPPPNISTPTSSASSASVAIPVDSPHERSVESSSGKNDAIHLAELVVRIRLGIPFEAEVVDAVVESHTAHDEPVPESPSAADQGRASADIVPLFTKP